MTNEDKYRKLLGDLREAEIRFKPGHKIYDDIVGTRDQVFARYRPVFSTGHIPDLTKEEFTSFLYFENNRHWSGLYRQGLGAASDMQTLRAALELLLDENKPIRKRLPDALGMVMGLGKAIATGILTVAYPDRYGVWNNTSEAALREAGLWPNIERGEGSGGRYEKVNDLLRRLSTDLQIDLWTLDAMWWFILDSGESHPLIPAPPDDSRPIGSDVLHHTESFALERQLEEFLLENWSRTPLAQDWRIYSTPEDVEAGNQFPTEVGRIDILATHRTEPRFLVIELKRNQSTDQTVGQALRYLGWVKKNLATEGQSVEALIIAHKAEKDAQYALSTLTNVRMMEYEIEFRLKEMRPI